MRHLSDVTLARLVDDRPTGEESEHLQSCEACTASLRELRAQTEALASLPEIRPPHGEWQELERRLVAEGLVTGSSGSAAGGNLGDQRRESGFAGAPFLFRTGWLQTAAALILFLGGTGFGAWIGDAGSTPGSSTADVSFQTDGAIVDAGEITSMEEAALYVQSAEEVYVDALLTYRELLGSSDGGASGSDPASRVAALEALVAASQAAVQNAPADPFFNGVLASAMAERQAAIRQISYASNDTWY